MSWLKRRPSRLGRQLALGQLDDAMAVVQPPAPVRLEVGTRVTAVTDAGQVVDGKVGRIY
jgi:hypothetical protein